MFLISKNSNGYVDIVLRNGDKTEYSILITEDELKSLSRAAAVVVTTDGYYTIRAEHSRLLIYGCVPYYENGDNLCLSKMVSVHDHIPFNAFDFFKEIHEILKKGVHSFKIDPEKYRIHKKSVLSLDQIRNHPRFLGNESLDEALLYAEKISPAELDKLRILLSSKLNDGFTVHGSFSLGSFDFNGDYAGSIFLHRVENRYFYEIHT